MVDTIDGDISPKDDYSAPSEMTMHRRRHWFLSVGSSMESTLHSICAMLDGILPNLLSEPSLTAALRRQGEGWLITIFSVMINC